MYSFAAFSLSWPLGFLVAEVSCAAGAAPAAGDCAVPFAVCASVAAGKTAKSHAAVLARKNACMRARLVSIVRAPALDSSNPTMLNLTRLNLTVQAA
jgi:hypothetical protein